MSMYGDDDYHYNMECLYNEIEEFLEEHPISELLKIVIDVIENKEYLEREGN